MKILNTHTVPELLNYSFKHFSKNNGFSFVDRKQNTYCDLKNSIAEIGNMLQLLGIKKGDKVAILAANSPNWVASFFAIGSMGAVVIPILPDFSENEISSILNHSNAKAIFVSSKLFSKIQGRSNKELEYVFNIDTFGKVSQKNTQEEFDLAEQPKMSAKGYCYENIVEDDLLSIIYTSGTTGSSKGVMLSHKNILWNAERGKEIQPVGEKDRFLSILPLSHSYENTIGMVLALMSGSSVYYIDKLPTPAVLIPAMKKIRPTVMLTVPLIMEKIYRGKVLATFNKKWITRYLYKLPLFRRILNRVAGKKIYESFGGALHFYGIGGAKIDPTVEQFLIDAKFPYAIGYGMTETSPLIAGALPGKTKLGSTGCIINQIEVRIQKENPNDEAGEIQVKGPMVMKGYYKSEELTAQAFTEDGWLKTGDLGQFDEDNNLYIKGRIKTMIVGASGENIYPEEIESVINKMDLVIESMVMQKAGKLVAMVHLNMEELEKRVRRIKNDVAQLKSEAIQKTSDLEEKAYEKLKDIQHIVNNELNKFSQIQQIVLQPVPFEKTPTMKLKRFMYQ